MSFNNSEGEKASNYQSNGGCEVIDLRKWENLVIQLTLKGLTNQEIATVTNIKKDSVKKLLESAIRRLLNIRASNSLGGINS